MKFIASFALASLAIAGSASAGRVCGTTNHTVAQITKANAEVAAHLASIGASASTLDTAATIQIPVVFQIVYKDTTKAGGYIPDADLSAQIDVLNADYAGTGFQFYLQQAVRTQNSNWFTKAGPSSTSVQTDMKTTLRKGKAATINFYTVGFKSSADNDYSGNPKDDGVVILFSSLPNGVSAPFNLGRTATHEIGHWLGLYHTFQGGCSGSGDEVADTPAEASPASGCPTGRDTCSGGGLDPIHNYMDYSDDSCMSELSAGQISRAASFWSTYRNADYIPPSGSSTTITTVATSAATKTSTKTATAKPTPTPATCAHDKCVTGVKLSSACDACVAQIIAADSFCGTNSWDSTCVREVSSICGLSC
ncbi:hypothetical protein BJ742DRAFT_864915 [Cladochytrium replicatum]|nr:hypothetical protein BJ742DRAFT_864915 [Cladochytrium replicatum]